MEHSCLQNVFFVLIIRQVLDSHVILLLNFEKFLSYKKILISNKYYVRMMHKHKNKLFLESRKRKNRYLTTVSSKMQHKYDYDYQYYQSYINYVIP